MGHRWIFTGILVGLLIQPTEFLASTGDVGTIIETFVTHQFPTAAGHYWVINETQWDGDEMIVDVHTIVKERHDTAPQLNRFLLLIVAGELKGAQNIPLDQGTDCRRDDEEA